MLTNLKSASRLLHPGLGLKRWFVPLLIGLVILGLGIGLLLRDFYANASYSPLLQLFLLQFLPRWARGVILAVFGIGLAGYSLFN